MTEIVTYKGKSINKKKTYKDWNKLVNMTISELKRFYDSKEGKEAGLSRSEAKSKGINYGRQSARWIMKMKPKGKSLKLALENWTPAMWWWADKQVRFIKRMRGNKGSLMKNGKKTPKHTSLLIWGHNPKK